MPVSGCLSGKSQVGRRPLKRLHTGAPRRGTEELACQQTITMVISATGTPPPDRPPRTPPAPSRVTSRSCAGD